MDIKTLRYFVEVVRRQSYTQAANALYVTQPTISKMLRNLEEEVGSTLLIREGRKLLLTHTGQVLYDHAETILAELRELETALEDINQMNAGTLQLGVSSLPGVQISGPVSLYRQRYPGIRVNIIEYDDAAAQQAVLNGTLDAALTFQPVDEQHGFASLPLFSYPLCSVVPRSGPWPSVHSVDLHTLSRYPLLLSSDTFAPSQQLLTAFTRLGLTPTVAVRSSQWEFLAQMVQAGMGIAVMPEPVCQKLDASTLLWLPLDSPLRWRLSLFWRDGVWLSNSTRAWIACCREFWPAAEAE
jgi:DNA-binding transcriptional LysR family regulator